MKRLYTLDSYVSMAGIDFTNVYSQSIYGGEVFYDKSQILAYKSTQKIWYKDSFNPKRDINEFYLQDASA